MLSTWPESTRESPISFTVASSPTRLIGGLLGPLDLLPPGNGNIRQALAARKIALGPIERRLLARDIGLGLIERMMKAPLLLRNSYWPLLTFSLSCKKTSLIRPDTSVATLTSSARTRRYASMARACSSSQPARIATSTTTSVSSARPKEAKKPFMVASPISHQALMRVAECSRRPP
jgi:hypothetical protein